ncbi:cysteine-rich CWC family protein [Acidovorax sp. JHL-9]|uniref:cysteine-rich CWC family protein n=1 Tax=Acidovorax sp. JHL-9 TaxID=1276756 RepID=UPI0009DBDD96|nr:cysteine-rich CWC family protein [Acidovorax sp. JHL-9]
MSHDDDALAPPSPSVCSLCGQPNQCAVAAGLPAQDCWCMHTPVSPAALACLPVEQRGLTCICPQCARAPVGSTEMPQAPAPQSI